MITIIIFTFCGCFFGLFVFESDIDKFFGSIILGLCGFLIGFVLCFSLPAEMEEKITETKIVEFNYEECTGTNIYLESGIIDGELKYFYFSKSENGDVNVNQIEAKLSKIQYYNGNPKIIEYEVINKSPKEAFINYFAFDQETKKYVIMLPNNSKIKEL